MEPLLSFRLCSGLVTKTSQPLENMTHQWPLVGVCRFREDVHRPVPWREEAVRYDMRHLF